VLAVGGPKRPLTGSASAEAVARALARARKLAGLGTRDFAAAVCETVGRGSLHPSTVSKWEHGVVIPRADVLLAAALIANVPIELLFNDPIAGRGPADRLLRLENRVNDLTSRVVQLTAVVDAIGPQPSAQGEPSYV
jgi:transcriptional regulator with XRE-family HTH domain